MLWARLRPFLDQRRQQLNRGRRAAFADLEFGGQQDGLLKMRVELDGFVQTAVSVVHGTSAVHRVGSLRLEQIGQRKLIPDLWIATIGVAEILKLTNGLGGIALRKVEAAIHEYGVIVDGILCQNVLRACGAVLVLALSTGRLHQVDARRQEIGRLAVDVFDEGFCFGNGAGTNLEVDVSEPQW